MNERDGVKLRDMRDTIILKARRFVAGRNRTDLDTDDMLAFAVVRAVEIVGETAAQLSQATRDLHPNLPWRNMIGMRNRIIHDYGNVDNNIV